MTNKEYHDVCDMFFSLNEHERRKILTMLETLTKKPVQSPHSIIDIALVKSYAYCEEYNPYTGKTEPKEGAVHLKQGFVDGFMTGFAHRMGGGYE